MRHGRGVPDRVRAGHPRPQHAGAVPGGSRGRVRGAVRVLEVAARAGLGRFGTVAIDRTKIALGRVAGRQPAAGVGAGRGGPDRWPRRRRPTLPRTPTRAGAEETRPDARRAGRTRPPARPRIAELLAELDRAEASLAEPTAQQRVEQAPERTSTPYCGAGATAARDRVRRRGGPGRAAARRPARARPRRLARRRSRPAVRPWRGRPPGARPPRSRPPPAWCAARPRSGPSAGGRPPGHSDTPRPQPAPEQPNPSGRVAGPGPAGQPEPTRSRGSSRPARAGCRATTPRSRSPATR